MAEHKRFVYYEHKGADYILDTPNNSLDFIEMLGDCLEPEEIVDLLNCLNDENEQLKQFKEDVFNKIDMHLRMLPTARDNEFNEENGDPSLYTGAICMLETLKKELQE